MSSNGNEGNGRTSNRKRRHKRHNDSHKETEHQGLCEKAAEINDDSLNDKVPIGDSKDLGESSDVIDKPEPVEPIGNNERDASGTCHIELTETACSNPCTTAELTPNAISEEMFAARAEKFRKIRDPNLFDSPNVSKAKFYPARTIRDWVLIGYNTTLFLPKFLFAVLALILAILCDKAKQLVPLGVYSVTELSLKFPLMLFSTSLSIISKLVNNLALIKSFSKK
jgi:hypothetical protein